MKREGGATAAKRAAGEAAAEAVAEGDRVGLGTGSTAAHAIRALGERVAEGLSIEAVATSHQSRALAREAGVPLVELADVATLDVAIDGADEAVPATGDLLKGGGAAHAREKVVDAAADRFLVVVDDSKLAETLSGPVPLEVLPAAESTVAAAVRAAGGEATLRAADRKDGPVVTDNGNLVYDCAFGEVAEPAALASTLASIPGVVEHGLFVGLADALYVGDADGDVAVRTPE